MQTQRAPQYLYVQHLLAHLILTTVLVWVLTFHMRNVSRRWVTHWPEMTQPTSACVRDQSLQSFSNSLQPCGLQPARRLCPWDSPGKNPGVGCHGLSRGSSQPGGQTCVPCSSRIAGRFSTVELNSNPSSVALEYLLLASTLYCLFCYQKGRRIHLKLI